MIPMNVNPDAYHLPDHACCEVVRNAAASAALEGHHLDDEWLTVLHDVATGQRTADEVVEEVVGDMIRRYPEG
jgi:Antitoxin VbhA